MRSSARTPTERRSLAATVPVAALLVVLAGAVRAAVLEVPSPYPTVQEALDAALPGDIVFLAPGSYLESAVVRTDSLRIEGGGSGLDVEWRGFSGWTILVETNIRDVVIANMWLRAAPGIANVLYARGGSSVELDGLTVQGGGTGFAADHAEGHVHDCVFLDSGAGISANGPEAILLERSVLSDNQVGFVASNGRLPTLRRNRLERNALYNLQIGLYSEPGTVDARENWWGVVEESDIRASIRNPSGSDVVMVLIEPWCTVPDCSVLRSEPLTWGRLRWRLGK
jgi:hypothetical protein